MWWLGWVVGYAGGCPRRLMLKHAPELHLKFCFVACHLPVGGCGGVVQGGLLPERYVITSPAANNGSQCPELDGATRAVTPCTNSNPCAPVACNGTWLTDGPCQAPCHSPQLGVLPEVYMVYSDAVDGGNPCPAANQTTRNTTACTAAPLSMPCRLCWLMGASCSLQCKLQWHRVHHRTVRGQQSSSTWWCSLCST